MAISSNINEVVHPAGKLEQLFVYFRTSNIFIYAVTTFIGLWVFWNLLPGVPHFDNPEEFGHLNLLLSMEATIATVLLMRDNARSRVREMEILKTIEMSIAKLTEIGEDIEDIQEEVAED